MTDEQQPQEPRPVEKKLAKKPTTNKPVEPKLELTQAIADAIIARDPKEGRSKIAAATSPIRSSGTTTD